MIKKIAIGTLVLAIALIVTGNSLLVCNLLNKEKTDMKKIGANIKKDYKVFKKDIEAFNEIREEYDEKVASNLFAETIDEYDEWIKVIDKYTDTIKKIDEDSKELKETCVNKAYADEDLNHKCSAFIIAYEESINMYVKDVTGFNEQISDIIETVKEEKIKEYNLTYKYVDINFDGITQGVE